MADAADRRERTLVERANPRLVGEILEAPGPGGTDCVDQRVDFAPGLVDLPKRASDLVVFRGIGRNGEDAPAPASSRVPFAASRSRGVAAEDGHASTSGGETFGDGQTYSCRATADHADRCCSHSFSRRKVMSYHTDIHLL